MVDSITAGGVVLAVTMFRNTARVRTCQVNTKGNNSKSYLHTTSKIMEAFQGFLGTGKVAFILGAQRQYWGQGTSEEKNR